MKTLEQVRKDVSVKDLSYVQREKERPVGWTFVDELAWQWITKDKRLWKSDKSAIGKAMYSPINVGTALYETYNCLANTLEFLNRKFGVKVDKVGASWHVTYSVDDIHVYEVGVFDDLAQGLEYAFRIVI